MLPVDKVEGVNPEVSGDFGPGVVNKVSPVLHDHGLDAEAGKVNKSISLLFKILSVVKMCEDKRSSLHYHYKHTHTHTPQIFIC